MTPARKASVVAFDGIALGGGQSTRMGTNKVVLPVDGQALLKTAVQALDGAVKIAVVAPAQVVAQIYPRGLPAHVIQTLEQPPFGGPVAGIGAGMRALGPEGEDIVGLVAGDHPRAPEVLEALQDAGALQLLADRSVSAPLDGVCAVDENGFRQPLLGFYSRKYLERQISERFGGSGRGVSVKRLLAEAHLKGVRVRRTDILDLDSPTDLERYRQSGRG